MIVRMTDLMKSGGIVRNLNRQQFEMDKVENQLATGKKINRPSDDPSGATDQMYFGTRLAELGQFERNVVESDNRMKLADGQLERVTDILQRVRVLTVQASNGIYQGDNGFELKYAIAKEIDQHLRSLVDIGNSKDGTGRALFGGFSVEQAPFRPVEAVDRDRGVEVENWIMGVQYNGDIGPQLRELDRSQYMDVSLPGSRVFWGTNMTVSSTVDASGYHAMSDQKISVDGLEIRIAAGDGIDDIIDKINNANLEIKAQKIGSGNISLSSTSPHQIRLEDVEGGSVLRDLGLIKGGVGRDALEYAEGAKVSGLSVFDVLIKLRNDLTAKDQLEVSGRDLGNIDQAIDNLLRHRSEVGAKQHRLEEQSKRLSWDKNYMTELMSQSEGVDIPEAIMNLRWLESVHNYALNVGARMMRSTLMDFLR